MKIFLLATLFLTSTAFANCEIETYAQIVKINKKLDTTLLKNSTCSSQVNKTFIEFVETANGKLNAAYLKSYFKNEYNLDVSIKPKHIAINHIKDEIKSSLTKNNIVIGRINSMLPQASITLNANEKIQYSCSNCDSAGSKNIKIQYQGKTHWLTTDILVQREAYFLKKDMISLNLKLNKNMFEKKIILDNGSKNLFTDISNVKYFQLTRYAKKNEILKASDFVPRMLVKFGDKVKVSIKNKNVQLSSIAISRSMGRFGDVIELENPKSKKKILARITDFNKAEIEL